MDLQKTIIQHYMLLNHQPTLRNIAKDTGIQMTRVFRILNGSTMKLSEYEIFHQRVKDQMGFSSSLENLAHQCFNELNVESIKEIENLMSRKIAILNIKKELQIKKLNQSIVVGGV